MIGGLTSANFGPGCAAVPTSGAGSFDGMAEDPAATAASNNPALSTLVDGRHRRRPGRHPQRRRPVHHLRPDQRRLRQDPGGHHDQRHGRPVRRPDQDPHLPRDRRQEPERRAAGRGRHRDETVEGSEVKIAEAGDTIEVNGTSAVVCGNVKVGNGTVQIIDTVLMPPGM